MNKFNLKYSVYTKMHKTMLRKIKEDLNSTAIPCSCIRKLNIVKIEILS